MRKSNDWSILVSIICRAYWLVAASIRKAKPIETIAPTRPVMNASNSIRLRMSESVAPIAFMIPNSGVRCMTAMITELIIPTQAISKITTAIVPTINRTRPSCSSALSMISIAERVSKPLASTASMTTFRSVAFLTEPTQ